MHVIVTGGGGMLASALSATWDAPLRAFARAELDVTDHDTIRTALRELKPDVVIHCAAYTRVDDAERESGLAFRVNSIATENLAATCNEIGALLVYPSTDYVFDGRATQPYHSTAARNPINTYGRSKAAGEDAAEGCERHLIVRTSWLYGPGGRNFVRTVVDRLSAGASMRVVDDQRGSPTCTYDLARAIRALVDARANGVFHYCNRGETTWFDFAREIARDAGLAAAITPCASSDYVTAANRPAYSLLDCSATEEIIGPIAPWQSSLRNAIAAQLF